MATTMHQLKLVILIVLVVVSSLFTNVLTLHLLIVGVSTMIHMMLLCIAVSKAVKL